MAPSHARHFRPGLAGIAFALGLSAWSAAPQAEEDCASLDVTLAPSAGFATMTCDQATFRSGDTSDNAESISASDATSFFVIHHSEAGPRTYFNRVDTRRLLDDLQTFASIEKWGAAPGGNGIIVSRFKGALRDMADLKLSCFGFSRFSGYLDRVAGYRHILYGFYCSEQPDDVSDADVRRLMGAVTFEFE